MLYGKKRIYDITGVQIQKFFPKSVRCLTHLTSGTIESVRIIFGQYKIFKLSLKNSSYRGDWKKNTPQIVTSMPSVLNLNYYLALLLGLPWWTSLAAPFGQGKAIYKSPAFITLIYIIGWGFSTEICEWVWFSKILNIWKGVFWKSQPYVCTQNP
jgi:hypothetical protein